MPDIPEWIAMPPAEGMITLSWEDIYEKGVSRGLVLKEQEVRDLFDEVIRLAGKNDGLYECFWSIIDYAIDKRTPIDEE